MKFKNIKTDAFDNSKLLYKKQLQTKWTENCGKNSLSKFEKYKNENRTANKGFSRMNGKPTGQS